MIKVTTGAWLRAIFTSIILEVEKPKPLVYAVNPETIGEHIRKVRLERGLFQKEVAKRIGVSEMTITNWETNKTKPLLKMLPKISDFLGYVPACFSEIPQLINPVFHLRIKRGISQRTLAKELGVDVSTVQEVEKGAKSISERVRLKLSNLTY